jgi:hypothetical protein
MSHRHDLPVRVSLQALESCATLVYPINREVMYFLNLQAPRACEGQKDNGTASLPMEIASQSIQMNHADH